MNHARYNKFIKIKCLQKALQYHMEEVSALSLYCPSRAQAPAGDEAQPEYLMRLLRDPSGSPQGRQR